jgi:DNA-directed RNA polymerase specialized sigma24 family protein
VERAVRELTVPDLASAISRLVQWENDPIATLVASKQLRVKALQSTIVMLESELRVLTCFAEIRDDWRTLPCRNKLRHVLGHGVAFAPTELAALLGHNVNTVRSTLMRMRRRGEVKRERHGRWAATSPLYTT